MKMNELLDQLENRAEKYHDGHYTILKFKTNWKCAFGTVIDREQIESLEGFKTLKEAVIDCLFNDVSLW